MYIIRPPPMSTRLAKDSARAVVASEQVSAIRSSDFTTMCFMVVRLSPSNSPARCPATSKITPSNFLLGEAQKQINCEAADPEFGGSSFVRFGSEADIRRL